MTGKISRPGAFTLPEVLVSVAVLTILLVFVNQMFTSTSAITTLGNKHIDTDSQARAVLNRMAEDFSQIVKRGDVDYHLKGGSGGSETGNDQLAFYSQVTGYYPTQGSQSPYAVVAYRVNSQNQLERMAKGLIWNAASPSYTPLVFLPLTIAGNWAAATNSSADLDYEIIGAQVIRFEYYYQLFSGDFTDAPWDTTQGHATVSGLRDVAAISVVLAVIDPQSRKLVTNAQLTTLTAAMNDHTPYKSPGNSGKVAPALQVQWQTAVNDSTIPKVAAVGIHFYQRFFYLNGPTQ
jgi:prepilin-type N-terminal cleavage/methylation domain-containing protein